jgi:hypothetical protein
MNHWAPPAQLCVPNSEGRLIDVLRQAAKTRNPRDILTRAAEDYCRAAVGPAFLAAEQRLRGQALADLSVTGRVVYGNWPVSPAEVVAIKATVQKRTAATSAQADAAVEAALDRAYQVAWALRGPASHATAARPALGWIAVSGEDDAPHRPVNLPTPRHSNGFEFQQYELPVTTRGVTLRTRFFIASAAAEPFRTSTPNFDPRALPPDLTPEIPVGHEVILFLHGHSSSAEEAQAIIPHIHAAGRARGRNYSVVAFDLPNSGYGQPFDHAQVGGATSWSDTEVSTPVLDFTEDFVVAFVNALDSVTPVKSRFAGVIGGSLGGNLGLRLGRRTDLDAHPWLRAGIVSWSAASVWDPIFGIAASTSAKRWAADETDDARVEYFGKAYDQWLPVIHRRPPELWYSDNWQPCKNFHIGASRVARREIYNQQFRQWHWRLAGEQLIFSHVDRVDRGNPASPLRYEGNTVRTLLAAGTDDDFPYAHIFSATRKLAQWMVNTPGRSLFLTRTGHSMHIERPRLMARQIVDFLAEQPNDTSFIAPLLLAHTGA